MFSILRRLFDANRPTYDPAMGDPVAQELLTLLEQADYSAAIRKIDEVQSLGFNHRQFYVRLVATNLPDEPPALHESPTACLVLGYASVEAAWRLRSKRRTHNVNDPTWKPFQQYLRTARDYFDYSIELEPDDPNPYAGLILVSMGLGEPIAHAMAYFAGGSAVSPAHRELNSALMYRVTQKWGGSHGQMFRIAEEAVSRSSRHALTGAVWFFAMAEYYLYLTEFAQLPMVVHNFLADSDRQRRGRGIFKRMITHFPQVTGPDDYWAFNYAAWWFYMVDDCERLAVAMRVMDGKYTEIPWAYAGTTPAHGFQKALDYLSKCP